MLLSCDPRTTSSKRAQYVIPLKKFKMIFNRLVSKVESRQCVKKQHTRIAAAIIAVVVTACKRPIVGNVLDKVNEVSQLFVIKVSKKMALLHEVVLQNPNYSRQQEVIFDMSITHWVEHLDGYN